MKPTQAPTVDQYETQAHRQLLNNPNMRNMFNGLCGYKGEQINAKSENLGGIEEMAFIQNYTKVGRVVYFWVEFVGDSGVWSEWVAASDCLPENDIHFSIR